MLNFRFYAFSDRQQDIPSQADHLRWSMQINNNSRGTMVGGRRHIEEQADVFLWMKKLGDEEILLLWMFCVQSASQNSHGNLILVPSLRLNFEDGSFMLL